MTMQHDLVSVESLSAADVMNLIHLAHAFKAGASLTPVRPTYAMNLFFENSTRTHTSFEMAEKRLGMQVLSFDAGHSSVTKGESLLDTLKTIQAIGVDIAVVRHPENGFYQAVLDAQLTMGLANAGDGSGQHPSQSLLDMMTIYEEFGRFEGLTVGIVGDLAHSRVARSNMMLLTRLGARVIFGGPAAWYPADFATYGPHVEIDALVAQVDVMMLLRVQHERLTAETETTFEAGNYHNDYGLTCERAARLNPNAIIMHPAPVNRGVEMASELVECAQSRIFPQMTNGMYMRMAILTEMLLAQGLMNPTDVEALR
ncbi:aspartate carbamoyltransferase catalytic subunit [Levilactobacillus bambusae]|uniref:Aspartate carbamoyltransferase n=1 Tax=Levilactobacillus bambusae TaxID=2024736 RepID=A0A2V1MY43_9LACO|nr:aspartate carbamoyltransferase catalytic subunit [Levilactobacillus bambusae]PWF99702.1 aspartate carbamoyltransferase [Levilactobacillus bambusae]